MARDDSLPPQNLSSDMISRRRNRRIPGKGCRCRRQRIRNILSCFSDTNKIHSDYGVDMVLKICP